MEKDLRDFPKQCRVALTLGNEIKLGNVDRIILAGVGGSSFAGEVLRALCQGEIEVLLNRDYTIEEKIGKTTLVFIVSYSGNTEEALYALEEALEKNCKIIGIACGGKLEKICKERSIDFIKVPSGVQPRNSLGYLLIPMLNILKNNSLIKSIDIETMIKELNSEELEKEGKRIAEILFDKIPIIYSSDKLRCLSYGWKIRFNENSKIQAFSNVFPELTHNEIVGYTKKLGNFHAIIIKDRDDHDRIKKRFAITKDLIESKGVGCTTIETYGSTLISRIFCTLHIANWASYYLALKYGIDPEPVDIVDSLKKKLNE